MGIEVVAARGRAKLRRLFQHGERLRRTCAVAGLSWPLPNDLDDAKLETKLYPADSADRNKAAPDLKYVHRELRRKGVTLELLWQEYRTLHPEGYGYSRFCDLYRDFRKGLDVVMRQSHAPGEKLFVDFAGMKLPIADPQTGEVHEAEVFVAAMGASSFTYAEALPSQELRHWLSAHVNTFEFLRGVPHVTVPDYVPWNIIGLLCPLRICAHESRIAVGGAQGHAEQEHF
jgi:transposase